MLAGSFCMLFGNAAAHFMAIFLEKLTYDKVWYEMSAYTDPILTRLSQVLAGSRIFCYIILLL